MKSKAIKAFAWVKETDTRERVWVNVGDVEDFGDVTSGLMREGYIVPAVEDKAPDSVVVPTVAEPPVAEIVTTDTVVVTPEKIADDIKTGKASFTDTKRQGRRK